MNGYKAPLFDVNPNSAVPIYQQLMEQVRRKISSGQLKGGDVLPSVRVLAKTHAINAMTISKAYSMLEAEGLLFRQRGKGMEVAGSTSLESKTQRLARLQASVDQLAAAAQQLELEADDVVRLVAVRMEQNDG